MREERGWSIAIMACSGLDTQRCVMFIHIGATKCPGPKTYDPHSDLDCILHPTYKPFRYSLSLCADAFTALHYACTFQSSLAYIT